MKPEMLAGARRLAKVLALENDALARLEYPRAVSLLPEKKQATLAFAAALANLADPGRVQGEAEKVITELAELLQQNKRLLEHAIGVQSRVVQTVARSASQALENGPRYDVGGSSAHRPGRAAFIALSATA